MVNYCLGGKTGRTCSLDESMEHIVVRTRERRALTADNIFAEVPLSQAARELIKQFHVVARFDEAGVEVLRANRRRGATELRDQARAILKKEKDIAFAGRLLTDRRSGAPVVYTENFFLKFYDDIAPRACVKIIESNGLQIKRPLHYARNAYFVMAADGTGQQTFAIAERLVAQKEVELCHPELIRRRRTRQAFPQQWHLKQTIINGRIINQHANVEAAWDLSDGKGTVIAVID
ncbi:MAG TPA: hypothetical protein VFS68_08290, partial [Candidatus Udaeobacter sp.]|nr:hypothetical protein [Candidatus Udaeobacter sp.]